MSGNEKTVKFVKAHTANLSAGSTGAILYWMKLLYEFWGFCVNGDNNLTSPGLGSFASFSGSLAPNYLQMAPGFESGSTVLIASGNDGATAYGTRVFTASSVNWTSGSMVGKWLVTWKSGSTSLDDSIYPIVQVLSSQSILVDTNPGATPMSASKYEPRFTDRGSINYRVVDFVAAHALAGAATGNYLILQFNANAINAGQANSQARIRLLSDGHGILSQGNISLSASGSWNGTAFNDIGPEAPPDGNSANLGSWSTSFPNGTSYFSFWGDQGAIIAHSVGSISTPGSWFHIEVPTRLFPFQNDPNPICFANGGGWGVDLTPNTATLQQHWAGGWIVHEPLDSSAVRRHDALVRNLNGHAATNDSLYRNMGNVANSRYQQAFYNVRSRKYVIQDVILSHHATLNNYALGRCQLRRTALATGPYQTMTKLGSNGEWLAVFGGILWPWDNSQLPRTLFPVGL